MESLTVKRMSAFLPKNVQIKCIQLLQNTYKNDKQLAHDVGWNVKQLNKALEGDISEEQVPRIFSMCLQHCPEIKDIVKEEVVEEMHRLCAELDIIGENKQKKIQQFMQSLQERDKAMLLQIHDAGYAKLQTLTALLRTQNDTQTLTRIREVINPISINILGKPIFTFHEKKMHPITGEAILFSWWLTEKILFEKEKEKVDIFDEDNKLRVVLEVPNNEGDIEVGMDNFGISVSSKEYFKRIPLYSAVNKIVQQSCKNGILEVVLEKEV